MTDFYIKVKVLAIAFQLSFFTHILITKLINGMVTI